MAVDKKSDDKTTMVSAVREKRTYVAALACAFLSMFAWLLPIIGIPVSVCAIFLSIKSLPATGATMALIISVLTLAAGGVNAYTGAQRGYNAATQQQTQQTQQSPTPVAPPTTDTAALDAWGYPEDFKANFTTSCVTNGGTAATCQCVLGLMEENYAYPQAQAFDQGEPLPSEFASRVQQTCG